MKPGKISTCHQLVIKLSMACNKTDSQTNDHVSYRTIKPVFQTAGPSGGIGRRDRFKICCPQGRARSSRAWGTNKINNLNNITLSRNETFLILVPIWCQFVWILTLNQPETSDLRSLHSFPTLLLQVRLVGPKGIFSPRRLLHFPDPAFKPGQSRGFFPHWHNLQITHNYSFKSACNAEFKVYFIDKRHSHTLPKESDTFK